MPRIRQLLHPVDPYRDFDHEVSALDLQGWSSNHPIFAQVIAKTRPTLIIEVGTWKGASAIHMARTAKDEGLRDFEIVCIDTWLGSSEHWLKRDDPNFFASLRLEHGHPSLYRQFLANVIKSGHADVITPLPLASGAAFEVLHAHRVQADLIYLDAGHGYADVRDDIGRYWRLLRPGGIMMGDDYVAAWPGVIRAVAEFSERIDQPIRASGPKWLFQKR
ncbi:MAG TPA: class I SAM-dependent methyltransferase [Alphaproteobacteria bacterium]|nr:class I SAM-dependent methyltransferase [Alphaproteobacteria bacterium]